MIKKLVKTSSALASWLILILVAYLPFHIFISTVVGVNIGGLEAWKASKDIAVVLISLLTLPFVLSNWPFVRKNIINEKVVVLCLAFSLLNVLFYVFNHKDLDSATLGLVYNTRYIILFLAALILAKARPDILSVSIISKIIVVSGSIVALFGIIQFFILPRDFLAKLGYSMQNGVLPWFYIDDKPDFFRIMSTMRDPNSLGSYLLLPISLVCAKLATQHKSLTNNRKLMLCFVIALQIFALMLAFSRSAVLGLAISLVVLVVIVNKQWIIKNYKTCLIIILSLLGVVLVSGVILMQVNPRGFQNIVFHADEETVLRDPNELRVDFIKDSTEEIANNPIGNGLGTAGLASMKNEVRGVNLTENYYLQLAIEVGLIGLAIFLSILFIVTRKLLKIWSVSKNYVAVALVASFAGLFVTNMLAHIWTNETIALTWWSFAAVVIAQFLIKPPVPANSKRSQRKPL